MSEVTDLVRPRFLPDKEAKKEWGLRGSIVARMIRRGFRVPPVACFGLSEIHFWLEKLAEYRPAIEAWRQWSPEAPARLAELQSAILRTPQPEHFHKTHETLRRLLTGAQDWPLYLRWSGNADLGLAPKLLEHPTPESLWSSLRELIAESLSQESALAVLSQGMDPRQFRPGVLVQPRLQAELSGKIEFPDEPLPVAIPPAAQEELRLRLRLAQDIVGGPARLPWVWDSEELWFLSAAPTLPPSHLERTSWFALKSVPGWDQICRTPLGQNFLEETLPKTWEEFGRLTGVRPVDPSVLRQGPEAWKNPSAYRLGFFQKLLLNRRRNQITAQRPPMAMTLPQSWDELVTTVAREWGLLLACQYLAGLPPDWTRWGRWTLELFRGLASNATAKIGWSGTDLEQDPVFFLTSRELQAVLKSEAPMFAFLAEQRQKDWEKQDG